jgi:hypothetical protein
MAFAGERHRVYSVSPVVAMTQKWVKELPQRTGRSLEEWIALTKKSGPPAEKERRAWLKEKHKLGTIYAAEIAERAEGKGVEFDSSDAYLKAAAGWAEAQYSGARAALRPVYDELLKVGLAVGKEARACPCKTMVPLYRNHVFAQIKASTNTRIDLGLAVGDLKTPKRLIDTGGFAKKDRITRRIEIRSKADLDDEVRKWLTKAYEIDK